MSQFWVDPDGLSKSGTAYQEVQERLKYLNQRVAGISERYSESFGDDDEGHKFRRNFNDGHGHFVDGIEQQGLRLEYISTGLYQNGESYEQSNDNAGVMSKRLLDNGGGGGEKPDAKQNEGGGGGGGKGENANGNSNEGVVKNPLFNLSLKSEEGSPNDPPKFVKSEKPDGTDEEGKPANGFSTPGSKPQEPVAARPALMMPLVERGGRYPLDEVDERSIEVREPAMTSSMLMRPISTDEQPLIGGKPLEEGQHLVTANELSNGAVRLNVDGYSDITPVDAGTGLKIGDPDKPDGAEDYPVGDGERVFLVTERPGAQVPDELGDQLYMEFPKDGAPSFFRMER